MRALISVSDKTGIVEFATKLIELGYEIISTGGTYNALVKAGLPVIPIDQVTGFPEMMDGRVKTLHPAIHGGLLALRDNPEHVAAASAHHIQFIHLVVVNLYPFEATIAKPNVTWEEAIENIDIGGPSMIRSAAKNHASVGVIVNPNRYPALLTELEQNRGTLSLTTKRQLALEAFTHTSQYDGIISAYFERTLHPDSEFPNTLHLNGDKKLDLRYGENPHQKAALYALNGEKGIPDMDIIQGKTLSYNNLLDLDAAWQLVRQFEHPTSVIVKHNNPCGVATANSLVEAYTKSYLADTTSAFGGIVGVNREVDAETATAMKTLFLEVIVAPGFSAEAKQILSEKQNLRLVSTAGLDTAKSTLIYRYVQGGFLVQTTDDQPQDTPTWDVVTTTPVDSQLTPDLILANEVVRAVKSNAIIVVKNGQTIGIGAGQMSRIEAVQIALTKAGKDAKGAVLASDAFFPFDDSVKLAAAAGITAIIQPGGSKKDQDSIDACNQHGIGMIMTNRRHFKH